MTRHEPLKLDQLIHNAKNPLNSISLHAELGKMLMDSEADNEKIQQIFQVILQQCNCCEDVLNEIGTNTKDKTSK